MSNEKLISLLHEPFEPSLMEQLWLQNSGIIHMILQRWKNRGIDIEDLEQEAYLALIEAVKEYKKTNGKWAFSTFLTNTINWHYIELYKKYKYIHKEMLLLNSPISEDKENDEYIDLLAAEVDIENDIINNISKNNISTILVNEICKLDAKIQKVLTYKYIYECSFNKIAHLMKLMPNTVKNLCNKGLIKLRSNARMKAKLLNLFKDNYIYSSGLKNVGFKKI